MCHVAILASIHKLFVLFLSTFTSLALEHIHRRQSLHDHSQEVKQDKYLEGLKKANPTMTNYKAMKLFFLLSPLCQYLCILTVARNWWQVSLSYSSLLLGFLCMHIK